MEMDLVDDLELLDGYDDFEFERFGIAVGDTSRQNKNKYDTTSAAEYRNGKDMQGIPWERLDYSRDDYRGKRLKGYRNYESLFRSHELLDSECKQVEKKGTFYDFCFNTRLAKSTVVHFQVYIFPIKLLRDLVWATSKHDVYMSQNYSVMHWSSLHQRGEEVLIPTSQKVHGARPLFRMQICSMAIRDNLMVAGGFRGELVCKYVDQPGVAFCTTVTEDNDNITNTVDVYESPNGSTRMIAGNNDSVVRVFDTERFRLLSHLMFPFSVNDTSVSPDGKLVAVLGDSSDCLIADLQSGKEITSLKGHLDYSFSSAWHPDGRVLATGNQDTTCRLWDVRNLSRSFAVLKGRISAVRGLRFSSDGRFLAMSEAVDFVHVYDSHSGYTKEQEIDIFGEIAGMSFSPDGEALFVGIADRTYGSLIEFSRRHRYDYLNSYL
ncbi:putative WD repeat-containing protein C2A9.03 [Dichanthelium oligosanthes]|uniref:Putative WD repeat-containing protein C2A9.03 n=1 Tax=Dichanthelium oligosanthes TaxID=888268 RepID=A0A1E5WGN4_9POAL|nr:putative WD repeat-containing protein C2A9.03 [Dichanthelium oligosanthes]